MNAISVKPAPMPVRSHAQKSSRRMPSPIHTMIPPGKAGRRSCSRVRTQAADQPSSSSFFTREVGPKAAGYANTSADRPHVVLDHERGEWR